MAAQTVALESVLINLDGCDADVKKSIAILLKAAEVAQVKGGIFNLRDAKLVASAFEKFVPENISTITPPQPLEGDDAAKPEEIGTIKEEDVDADPPKPAAPRKRPSKKAAAGASA
ncbi:hypothetical protein WJX74_006415 [Apatococcus lobatus]|uniref:Uncharacterized protein n=1 Tax=Apatococcus lobatus TaxID=904363 RepID=A0AAW1R001_9CHLO